MNAREDLAKKYTDQTQQIIQRLLDNKHDEMAEALRKKMPALIKSAEYNHVNSLLFYYEGVLRGDEKVKNEVKTQNETKGSLTSPKLKNIHLNLLIMNTTLRLLTLNRKMAERFLKDTIALLEADQADRAYQFLTDVSVPLNLNLEPLGKIEKTQFILCKIKLPKIPSKPVKIADPDLLEFRNKLFGQRNSFFNKAVNYISTKAVNYMATKADNFLTNKSVIFFAEHSQIPHNSAPLAAHPEATELSLK